MLRKGTIHMAAIIIAQFVSTVVVVAVQCVPIAKYWDPSVPGTCINITAFFYCKLMHDYTLRRCG